MSMPICQDCGGRGWERRIDDILAPGAHADYPHGLEERWWAPCEVCNPDNVRKVEAPEDEP